MERRNSQLWQRNVTFHQPQTLTHSSQPSHALNRDPTFELIVRSPTPVSPPPPPPVPTNTPDPEHNPQSTSRPPPRATYTRPVTRLGLPNIHDAKDLLKLPKSEIRKSYMELAMDDPGVQERHSLNSVLKESSSGSDAPFCTIISVLLRKRVSNMERESL